MREVPGHVGIRRGYVDARLKALASSEFLAGQAGESGAPFEGREWTSEFPCDNEIVLHVFSVWMSRFLDGTGKEQRTSMVFREKHMAIGSEKQGEGDYIYICTEGKGAEGSEQAGATPWSRFFIRTNMGRKRCDEKFWGGVGRDALYEVLVMFVWILKQQLDVPWRLDCVSLKNEEIGLNRVFHDDR
jgi:hypothetical protein